MAEAMHAFRDVCLLWEAAARRLEVQDMVVSLTEVLQTSRTELGYCPIWWV